MTLDESRKNDETFNERGLTFIIDKQLFEQVKPVKIDYVSSALTAGFAISYNSPASLSGDSCGSTYSSKCG